MFRSNINIYIALENIRSLFNIGAVFRTCNFFGFINVILVGYSGKTKNTKNKTILNKEVLKSSLGSEKDLQIRGGGDLYGTAQSGYGFRIATLSNLDMVERSRKLAEALLRADLTLKKHSLLAEKLQNHPLVHLE